MSTSSSQHQDASLRAILDESSTIPEALSRSVAADPERECLILHEQGEERRLTLADFWSGAGRVHAELVARGVSKGDSVVLILPTGEELLSAYFGAMLAGASPTLIAMPAHRVADQDVYLAMLSGILENAAAPIVYCRDEAAALLRGAGPDLLGGAKVLEPHEIDPTRPPARPASLETDDIAGIQYSSGTTGRPKGVLLSHRTMLTHLRSLRDGLEITPDDVHVNWIPLYHDMGLFGCFLLPLLCGCRAMLIPTLDFLREPVLWLRAMHRHRGSVCWAPNFSYSLCAKRIPDDALEGLDLSSWRLALSGSEPVLAATVEVFTKRFAHYGFAPEALTPTWGLAEATMAATAHPVAAAPLVETVDRRALVADGRAVPCEGDGVELVATGRCLPGYALEIRDGEGRRLPDRHLGDVWVGGEALFSGYRDDPELTARVKVDGWVHTGDQGYLVGPDFFFVSRDKDVIVIGGEKHSPQDVENVINQVPGVREGCAAAFGVPSADRGTEELGAVVETREPDESLPALTRTIRAEVRERLGLALRHLLLVPPGGIEKTTSGKLARRATLERYREEFAR